MRLAVLALCGALVAGGVGWGVAVSPSAVALPRRNFMPGDMGWERGTAPRQPAANAFLTRAFSGIERVDGGAWARENGLGRALGFSHNLAEIFPADLAGKHPEFFPLVQGLRLSPTKGAGYWNPDLGRLDVAEWTAEAARRHFARFPEDVSFAIGINDGLAFGESAETLARVWPPRWFRGRPNYSDLIFGFANRAAESLSTTHPDKYLGALAYYWCEQVPDFAVHRQVIPFLTADRSQGYDRSFRAEELALQARWAQAGPARLGLYDYVYGHGFLVPRQHPHLLAENLRAARRLGFTDYYAEVGPNWGIDGPQPWVLAQLLLDPEQPVEGLLDEYYARHFREAAAPMRRFFERCEAQWLSQSGSSYWLKHFRNESQATLFPSAVCGELRRELSDAKQLARSERVRDRTAFVADAFSVSERLVALQERRAELSRWLAKPNRNTEAGLERLERYLAARRGFIVTARDVTRRLPLAFAPINYDDFLRNDPTFAAALALVQSGSDVVQAKLGAVSERDVREAVTYSRARQSGQGVERLQDGSLETPPLAAQIIAGLAFGIGLPEGWKSQVEPTERHRGELTPNAAHTGNRGLRISGATNTTVYRWLSVTPGAFYVTQMQVRGRVTPSNAVTLGLGWLDEQQRHLGTVEIARLPDGSWPDWQTLTQGARAPATAAWVGLGLRVQNQMPGDWAEFDDFSLVEVIPASR